MASVFLYHVVGDLTVGKPELVEFLETETVEAAIRAIGESTEGGIPVWKRKPQKGMIETGEMRQQRVVGILNSLDIVAFLAKDWCLENQEKAMKTPVSEVVIPNNSLLKEVHPATSCAWIVDDSKTWLPVSRLDNIDSYVKLCRQTLFAEYLGQVDSYVKLCRQTLFAEHLGEDLGFTCSY